MEKAAVISPCGRYRYWLSRTWDRTKSMVGFIMLNPSTADATVDDPTIRKCVMFAEKWGAGSISVTNLYAWRATDPRELDGVADPVGPENAGYIHWQSLIADTLVTAWGANADAERARQVVRSLRPTREVHCLTVTKGGHPAHPLFLPSHLVPVELGEVHCNCFND
jgi:hypothetical protein